MTEPMELDKEVNASPLNEIEKSFFNQRNL